MNRTLLLNGAKRFEGIQMTKPKDATRDVKGFLMSNCGRDWVFGMRSLFRWSCASI
jgi:hypothetical protein